VIRDARRPPNSWIGPARAAPIMVQICAIAFQRLCQYAGIMYPLAVGSPYTAL
jgi:hypothetical protein